MADKGKEWVGLDPNLKKVFGSAGQMAIEITFNTGVTVVVPPEVAKIIGMLGPPQRRVNLDQTATNILANPRPDELEQLARLANDEEKLAWALTRAKQIAIEAGYSVDS